MRIFAGPHRTGFITILTALLLPVLGIGVASADMVVGDTVMLKVPDLSEFPNPIEEHQFTCRAVTANAYWLVQDSVSVAGTGPGVLDTTVWNNLIDQVELDILTLEFEGGGVDVYGTVVEYYGAVPDTDDDPRVWIVMATIPDGYQQPPTDRKVMAHVDPADVDTSGAHGDFNNHDIFYINLHSYTSTVAYLEIAKQLRKFYIPNGLGMLIRTAVQPIEEQWVIRGIGATCQYLCYGMTRTDPGNYGLAYNIKLFERNPDIDLTFYQSNDQAWDYGLSRAQAFLWFMYLAQREGNSILETIAQSDGTGLLNIANAIDPTVHADSAIQVNVVPIYNDWLVCNVTNNLSDDMSGGIYMYDIFADSIDSFSHAKKATAFEGSFSEGDYPFPVWLPDHGMAAAIWAPQLDRFTGDYTADPTVYFNGAYADDIGSGSLINGKWTVIVVSVDTTAIDAIVTVSLNDLYNGSFELAGDYYSYLILTNNNDGGPADLKYVLSQDSDVPEVLLAVHQNSINDQYMTLYTTLYNSIPEGFDWYGPIFTASTVDTSNVIDMELFFSTLWDCRFSAWTSGDYTLQVAGYDSSGFSASTSTNISVGYVSTTNLSLNVNDIHLDVMAGAAAPGTMVSLCESGILNLSMHSQISVADAADMMTGINAGPVSIPDINATLSFPAETSEGAVYRYTVNGWEKQDSYYQGGRMCAPVTDGGNYVYGDAPGVYSPEIPAEFHFGGTYPNPFSAEAAISFSLPSAGRVNVIIYDMSGRAVRTLTDTEMQAAEHTLMWDGLDQAGNAVGAGVYFCRLQACGETVTQKMLRIE